MIYVSQREEKLRLLTNDISFSLHFSLLSFVHRKLIIGDSQVFSSGSFLSSIHSKSLLASP